MNVHHRCSYSIVHASVNIVFLVNPDPTGVFLCKLRCLDYQNSGKGSGIRVGLSLVASIHNTSVKVCYFKTQMQMRGRHSKGKNNSLLGKLKAREKQ